MSDAPNKEVLRYELDASDVEAKSARLQQTLAANKTAAERGDAAAAPGAAGEAAALGGVEQQATKTKGAMRELLREKRNLGDVVSLLGGRFQGLIGDMAGVVEIIRAGSPVVAGFAASLAGVTAAIGAWRSIQAEIQKAIELQKEYLRLYFEGKAERVESQDAIVKQLMDRGALSDENVRAAAELRKRVAKEKGLELSPEEAADLAAAEISDTQDAAVATVLRRREGVTVKRPEDLRALLDEARRSGGYEAAAAQVGELAASDTGKTTRARARGGTFDAGPRTAEDIAFEEAKGKVPGVGTREEFDAALKRAEELKAKIDEMQKAAEAETDFILGPKRIMEVKQAREELERLWPILVAIENARRDAGGELPTPHGAPVNLPAGVPAGESTIQQTINNFNTYIQNQYTTADPSRHTTAHPTASSFGDLGEGN